MLALDVAASASSPRKRPTQIALIEPLSDWRTFDAKRRQREGEQRRGLIGPRCRSRLPARRPPRPRPSASPQPRQRRRQPLGFRGACRHGRRAPSRPPRAWRARRSSELARRPASASRSFSAAAIALVRRARSASRSITSPSGRTKVASSTTICSAPPAGASPAADRRGRAGRAPPPARSSRAAVVGRCVADMQRQPRARRHVQLGPRRAHLAHQPDQPVDLRAASGSIARASAIGHCRDDQLVVARRPARATAPR